MRFAKDFVLKCKNIDLDLHADDGDGDGDYHVNQPQFGRNTNRPATQSKTFANNTNNKKNKEKHKKVAKN